MNDIKLRKLLWDTMESWYKTVAEWFEADYLTLDVEDMNTFTAKCVKNVTQLEKGLPRNLIVPKLKEDIATVKDKVRQCFFYYQHFKFSTNKMFKYSYPLWAI